MAPRRSSHGRPNAKTPFHSLKGPPPEVGGGRRGEDDQRREIQDDGDARRYGPGTIQGPTTDRDPAVDPLRSVRLSAFRLQAPSAWVRCLAIGSASDALRSRIGPRSSRHSRRKGRGILGCSSNGVSMSLYATNTGTSWGYGLAVFVAWLSASTSASSNVKVSAPAFWVAWLAFLAPGMGSTPSCWISHRRATCVGLLSWRDPISRSNSTRRSRAARFLPRK